MNLQERVAQALAETEATFAAARPETPAVHAGKVNTTSIAVIMDAKGYRGGGKERKSDADTEAKLISDAVLATMGLRGKTVAFEGE